MATERFLAAAWRKAARKTGWAAALAACLVLPSCVGPDFALPAAPEIAAFTPDRQPADNSAGGTAQRLEIGNKLPADWWVLFHSSALNALVERALRDNPNIPAAQAALRVTQANVYAEAGQLLPTAGGNYQGTGGLAASQVSSPLASGANYYTLHTGQFTVSYVPDIWGGTRRRIENLEALKDNQRFANEATFLTLTSSVALGAIQEASLRGQIGVTERLIGISKGILEKVRLQKDLGQATGLDVASQEALAAQTEATLPPLRKALAIQRDALIVLSGHLPGEGLPERFDFAGLKLPRSLPVSLPSELVVQRPDVRAAEENLHAASALIGVAIANRLPQFSINGDIGRQGTALANLLSASPQFFFYYRARERLADHLRWLHPAAKAAGRRSGLRPGGRAIPDGGAYGISECGGRALCHPARYGWPAKGHSGRSRGEKIAGPDARAIGRRPGPLPASPDGADHLSPNLACRHSGAVEPL